MSTDPAELGTLEGGDGGPPPGTPTPTGADPRDERIALLEQENAKLREDRRGERARALGAELKLPATAVELLKTVPADQIEEKAKALADELGSLSGSGPPPQPAEPPPSDPPDPSLEVFGNTPGGAPQADPALSFQDELNKRISEAKDMAEIAQIQQEFKQRQRGGS